jgi:hypothetical protein
MHHRHGFPCWFSITKIVWYQRKAMVKPMVHMVQYFIIFIFMIFLLQSNCHDLCSPASGEDALRPTVPEELGSDVHEHVRQNHLDGMTRENGCSLGLITQGQAFPDGANGSISLGKTPARCKTGIW